MSGDTEAKAASAATVSDLDILRGRKTYVRIYVRPWDGDGEEPPTEKVAILLSNNSIAALERHFTSQTELGLALANRPVDVIRTVLSIVLGCSIEEAGDRVITSEIDSAWAAVEGACAIALGQSEAMAEKVVGSRMQRQRAIRELQELRYAVETSQAANEVEDVVVGMLANLHQTCVTTGLDWTALTKAASKRRTNGASRGRSNGTSTSGAASDEASRSTGA